MASVPAAPAPSSPPLLITVRFSSSLPDLTTDVPSPSSTTVLAFRHSLRARIASRSRLRLIYQGRILPDAASLASVLKPLPAPPPAPAPAPPAPTDKGKAVVRPPPPVRVYLNCSIGDELTTAELDAEEAAAAAPPGESAAEAEEATRKTTTKPRPRGFDRLLQAGFTTSEVATLRTQLASIRAERFAPDEAPPSPDTMRRLEDAWIDGNAGDLPPSISSGGGGGGGRGPLDDDGSDMSTVLDVLIRAMMIGFFFPLGSMTWLLRQDVWGDKWRIFVGSGVVLSLTVGIFMTMGGDR
ncbi:putative protein family UPF0645, transmembrane [Cordyceps fumosorosea ARSEF 2679]|uniref:Ubiquitin-like domain-containing protein n=1 Tax=Cordyceps fumosorosea (strain ARSEF 2679) TaxID=1081104 RepID=A0A162LFB8_CORFA|nr:putative protein family UPF0645, transmembrane [Cordyceps fumosorosea ARSEF 2679]OAA69844.1 putative protein family UPF0645, transmembrane [Cordyceps fumosorosea ARSEF 2679]